MAAALHYNNAAEDARLGRSMYSTPRDRVG